MATLQEFAASRQTAGATGLKAFTASRVPSEWKPISVTKNAPKVTITKTPTKVQPTNAPIKITPGAKKVDLNLLQQAQQTMTNVAKGIGQNLGIIPKDSIPSLGPIKIIPGQKQLDILQLESLNTKAQPSSATLTKKAQESPRIQSLNKIADKGVDNELRKMKYEPTIKTQYDKPIQSKGKLNWTDKVQEIADRPEKLVPFISSASEAKDLVGLLAAANRYKDGKATDQDMRLIRDFIIKEKQDKTFGYKVLDVVSQIPAFAGELAATGGIATFGKKGATKGIKYLLSKAGKELAEKDMEKLGFKIATGVAGQTLRTPAAGATRIAANTLLKQVQTTLSSKDKASREDLTKSVAKAFGEQWVETLSEFSGGILSTKYLPKPIRNKIMSSALLKAFQKVNPGKNTEAISKLFNEIGYNGMLGEMFEERVADVGNAVLQKVGLSDQKFKLPSGDQLLVEAASFAVPGLAGQAISKLSPEEARTKLTENLQPENDPQTVINEVIKQKAENTEEGKALIKEAVIAQKTGEKVVIDKVQPLNIKGLDETTNTKIEELNRKDAESPAEEGKIRVYQAVEKGKTSDYVFKTPKELAQFKNNVTSPTEEFKYIDVKPEQLQAVESKPGVYQIQPSTPQGGVKTYADIHNVNPDETITIYRGVRESQAGKLKGGEWVTQDKELAKLFMRDRSRAWNENGRIITQKVKASELAVSPKTSPGVDNEFIYQPKSQPSTPQGGGETKIQPKEVSVPKEQLPVGEGKEKVSRLEARMKGVMDSATDEQIQNLGLTTYQQMNKKETIAKAAEYVSTNRDDAIKVLKGDLEAPKGIPPEALYIALTQASKEDATLITKLASLQATAIGQRLSLLTELDTDSPVKLLNEVYKIREEQAKKKYKNLKKVVDTGVENAKKEIKQVTKYDWNNFINSIDTC